MSPHALLPLSPFITEPDNRFVLDERAFLEAIEPVPGFFSAPREIEAFEIMPILQALAEPRRRIA